MFQATLVQTEDDLWFLQVYYNPLGSDGQVRSDRYESGQRCRDAQVGYLYCISRKGHKPTFISFRKSTH